jgi:hypothetical protein
MDGIAAAPPARLRARRGAAIIREREAKMRLHQPVGLFLLFVVLGWSGKTSEGADPAAEATLKEKGLTKSVSTYVIDAEKPVLAKMKEVRGLFANYAMLADRQAAAEQATMQAAQLEEHRAELQSSLEDLNERIVEQGSTQSNNFPRPGPPGGQMAPQNNPLIAQRDQIKLALAEVSRTQKTLKTQAPQAKDKSTLEEDLKKKEESFKTALTELRQQVDEVTKKYAELGADPSVKKALDTLKKASKANVKLGPSDAFLAAVKQLDQAERQFLGKKTTTVSKKKAKAKK